MNGYKNIVAYFLYYCSILLTISNIIYTIMIVLLIVKFQKILSWKNIQISRHLNDDKYSFLQAGLYQESVLAYDVVLGDGSLVRATQTENDDLFYALPWSHGSLGFLVALDLKIVHVKVSFGITHYSMIWVSYVNWCGVH
jgi:NAD kinase